MSHTYIHTYWQKSNSRSFFPLLLSGPLHKLLRWNHTWPAVAALIRGLGNGQEDQVPLESRGHRTWHLHYKHMATLFPLLILLFAGASSAGKEPFYPLVLTCICNVTNCWIVDFFFPCRLTYPRMIKGGATLHSSSSSLQIFFDTSTFIYFGCWVLVVCVFCCQFHVLVMFLSTT